MALKSLDLRVTAATRANVDWMIRKHYLGKWPGVVVGIFLLLSGREPVGVIVFALPPRESFKRFRGVTWELARLWVSDVMPRNTESWFIAESLRLVRSTTPEVSFVVSYADPSKGHVGTIYRAANFVPDGRTDQERKSPRHDYESVSVDLLGVRKFSRRGHATNGDVRKVQRVSKHRYVMPMNKRARKMLKDAR